MSDLKKTKLTVKNYNLKASGDLDAVYDQVRCEDVEGRTFHFKEVAMVDYLKRHGALVLDSPRTWYYKNLGKKSIVLIAVEKSNGKVEYDLDNLRQVAKSSILKGILMAVAAVPGGIIIATATYGLGLLFIPFALYYTYRGVFKIPGMLRRKTLVDDLAAHGVIVR
ncbi:hypothetical protein [Pseudomonas bijieensis]|uniref:Uncharacterized protein n=1 Tax=Pseudomonas bijieensis TaxID=2681983 RepID=A0A6N1C6Q7_9PSED|nr:hypothetical protein [Pseudomonas bijieensis]QKS80944.1 hypothetical protein GN234_02855 [Pseudomonas bijieensis]